MSTTSTNPKIAPGQLEDIPISKIINLESELANIVPPVDAYIHPTQDPIDTTLLSGSNVISRIQANELGHIISVSTRSINLSDIGAQPEGNYEVVSNKSTSISLGTSNTLYPTQNAVKSYVDTKVNPKANSAITLTAGDGLSGGGNLTANRSFSVDSTVIRTNSTDQTKIGIFRIRRGSSTGEILHTAWEYPDNNGNDYNLRLYNDGTGNNVKWYYKQKIILGTNDINLTVPVLGFKNGITVIGDTSYPATGLEIEDYYNDQTEPAVRHPLRLYAKGLSQFEGGIIVGTNVTKFPLFDGNVKAFIGGDVVLGRDTNGYRTIGVEGTSDSEAYISLPNYSSFNKYNARALNGHYFSQAGNNIMSISGNGIASVEPGGIPGSLGPSWKFGTASDNATNTVDKIIRIQIGSAQYDLLARLVV